MNKWTAWWVKISSCWLIFRVYFHVGVITYCDLIFVAWNRKNMWNHNSAWFCRLCCNRQAFRFLLIQVKIHSFLEIPCNIHARHAVFVWIGHVRKYHHSKCWLLSWGSHVIGCFSSFLCQWHPDWLEKLREDLRFDGWYHAIPLGLAWPRCFPAVHSARKDGVVGCQTWWHRCMFCLNTKVPLGTSMVKSS